jgi:lipoprotein-releasing system permease protein
MLEREHAVSAILIRTQHPERVRRALEELLGEEFRVVDSEELRASFYRLVRLEKWGIFFIALLVLLIASFSVVGALSMLILEKRDERLTLHALGASDGFIRSIFRREGYLICLLGGVIGLVLGVALSLAQQELGLIRMPVETFLTDAYPVKLRATNLLLVAGVTALVGWGLCSLTVHNMIKQEKRL